MLGLSGSTRSSVGEKKVKEEAFAPLPPLFSQPSASKPNSSLALVLLRFFSSFVRVVLIVFSLVRSIQFVCEITLRFYLHIKFFVELCRSSLGAFRFFFVLRCHQLFHEAEAFEIRYLGLPVAGVNGKVPISTTGAIFSTFFLVPLGQVYATILNAIVLDFRE